MKYLKNIGLGIIVIILLALVVAIFVPGEYVVERSVKINKPKQEVFDYLVYLKNQDNYSVWANIDPDMKKEFKGTDATVGFVSSWSSEVENVGVGEQEIKNIIDGSRIEYEIRFTKPFKSTDQIYLSTAKISDSETKVVWGFNGKMPYPMNLMMIYMDMDSALGPDLQKGLDNLKIILEK